MKTSSLIITLGLALVSVSALADKASYQSTIAGQNPTYLNHFDNSLAPTTGSGTFTATGGATAGSDAWGNANSAVSFATTTDQLSVAGSGGNNIINNVGTGSTSVGSLSLLFYVPSTWNTPTPGVTNNMIIFSQGDASANSGNFSMNTLGTGLIQFKAWNRTEAMGTVNLQPSTWYYTAITWDSTVASGATAVNWYLGAMGSGTLYSGSYNRGSSSPNVDTTKPFGNPGDFTLSGKQGTVGAATTTGLASGANPGEVDELATWNSVLSSTQINAQFAATTIPEPSTFAVLGVAGLLLIGSRRIRGLRSL